MITALVTVTPAITRLVQVLRQDLEGVGERQQHERKLTTLCVCAAQQQQQCEGTGKHTQQQSQQQQQTK